MENNILKKVEVAEGFSGQKRETVRIEKKKLAWKPGKESLFDLI